MIDREQALYGKILTNIDDNSGVIPTSLTIIDGLLKNKFQSCIVQLMLCDTRVMTPYDNLILQDKV